MSKWAQGLAWSGPLLIEPSSLNQVYIKGEKEWMCDLETVWFLVSDRGGFESIRMLWRKINP